MSRTRTKAGEEAQAPEKDVFDEQIDARKAEAATQVQKVADSTAMPPESNGKSHAAGIERKKFTPAPDPFGTEGIKAGENRIHLLREEPNQREGFPGAWVIRFDHNPNEDKGLNGETYSKENPHPVLKMLKEEGYRWGFATGDGKGGWGKKWDEGHFKWEEHAEAREVLKKAAEMMGAEVSAGRSA
jgi:hypothetical protein